MSGIVTEQPESTLGSCLWDTPNEFSMRAKSGEARGNSQNLSRISKEGGYSRKILGMDFVLSARGNPITKATKHGNRIIMHLSSGKDIELKPLKMLKEEEKLSREGLIAMAQNRGS